MAEIEFLTLHGRPGDLVVYAGAAPGIHTNYLANLFPSIDFVLIDPAHFEAKEVVATSTMATVQQPASKTAALPVPERKRVTIRRELLTERHCHEFKAMASREGRDILLLSDIRNNHVTDETIAEDQRQQMQWHDLIGARVSLLKFRLPWDDGFTPYVDGTLYFPIWGRETTTECRLVVHGNRDRQGTRLRLYSHRQLEEQMSHFNRVTRVEYYQHDFDCDAIPGLDHCYDCAAELKVLSDYVASPHGHALLSRQGINSLSSTGIGIGTIGTAGGGPTSGDGGGSNHPPLSSLDWECRERRELVKRLSLEMNGHCTHRHATIVRTLAIHEACSQVREKRFRSRS